MHRRFRKGLQHMIAWYRKNSVLDDPEDDVEEDTVLILVTHGAGCNALIGAVTNQPVLLDVGMASLTMAVVKDDAITNTTTSPPSGSLDGPTSPSHSRRSSLDAALSNDYDMYLTASTEHLRAGSNPLSVPQLQSPRVAAKTSSPSTNRPRYGSGSSDTSFTIGESVRPQTSAGISNSSLYRSQSAASPYTRGIPSTRPVRSGSGLWSGGRMREVSNSSASGSDDGVPNFGKYDSFATGTSSTATGEPVTTTKPNSGIKTPLMSIRTNFDNENQNAGSNATTPTATGNGLIPKTNGVSAASDTKGSSEETITPISPTSNRLSGAGFGATALHALNGADGAKAAVVAGSLRETAAAVEGAEGTVKIAPVPTPPAGPKSLWGGGGGGVIGGVNGGSAGEAVDRDVGTPKRRWTVAERKS